MIIKQNQPPKSVEVVKVPASEFAALEMVEKLVKPYHLKVVAYRGDDGYWLSVKAG